MARRFSGRAKFRGGGRGNRPRWTALVDTYTLAAAAVDESVVIAPADYQTSTSLENDATFVRLRGSLQITNTSVTLASTVVMAVMKINAGFGVGTFDPASQANLQNGEILWTQILQFQPQVAASSESTFHFENIDIKSKRKLSAVPEGDRISLVVSNVVGGGTIAVAFVARALMTLKA